MIANRDGHLCSKVWEVSVGLKNHACLVEAVRSTVVGCSSSKKEKKRKINGAFQMIRLKKKAKTSSKQDQMEGDFVQQLVTLQEMIGPEM
jgi:hypothetical protein